MYKFDIESVYMINKELESNLEGELKYIHEKMFHNDVIIKNLTEQNRVLQHEIPQLHNEKLELISQLKNIKKITERY